MDQRQSTHVSEILEEFSCFIQPQIVCKLLININLIFTLLQLIQEFTLIANITSDDFDKNLLTFSQKIISYAEVES